tara:strand:+ start:400 stop:1389 length:990 start_codon:yes stop_codon:yes gene_type:complete
MKLIKKNFIYLLSVPLFVCLSVSNVWSFELKIDNPNFIPAEFKGFQRLGCGNGHLEVEYESNFGMIDEQKYKSNECRISTAFVPWKRLMLGIDLHYDIDREYELKFGPLSNRAGEPNYYSSSSGFLDPEIVIAYEFESEKESWNQQIYFKMNPFDIEEQPKKIFRGGHDIFLEYRFSHKYEEDSLYGRLYSHYFGKKNFYQPGDSRKSVKEAYTEVGLELGYIWRPLKKWSFQLGGEFALSSDYDVVTPELTKTADKGYLIGARFRINYALTNETLLQFSHWRSSRVYNATNEDRSNNLEIDYEIEEKSFFFALVYQFDMTNMLEGFIK